MEATDFKIGGRAKYIGTSKWGLFSGHSYKVYNVYGVSIKIKTMCGFRNCAKELFEPVHDDKIITKVIGSFTEP